MHLPILKRCGQVLIAVAVLDVVLMILSVANGNSYNSSLIFGAIGGILLMRGGLKTSRWVATLATFMLAMGTLTLVLFPFIYPFGYWLAVLRSDLAAAVSLALGPAVLAVLYWVRQQVLRPEVLEAQRAAALPPPRTKLALVLGTTFPPLLVTISILMFRGDTAREAVRRAEQELGGNYRYVVTSLQMSSTMSEKSVSAIVAAYNDRELRSIQLRWKE